MTGAHPRLLAAASAASIAAAAGAWTLGGTAVARVVTTPLRLDEAPFAITLGGPLWTDRTLRDGEGTPDIAYVTRDERLTVTDAGREGARVGAISYRVDHGPAATDEHLFGAILPAVGERHDDARATEHGAGDTPPGRPARSFEHVATDYATAFA